MRVATDELVVDPGRDVGDREPAFLLGDRRMEFDLIEQVAEFLDEVFVGGGVGGVERLDRVDDLVGLLDEMGNETPVGLFDVPGALLSQGSREFVEPHVPGADRHPEGGHVQRRQVVGLDRPIHVGPRGLDEHLVGRAERVAAA